MNMFEAFPDFIARLESIAADPASPAEVRDRCRLTLAHYRGKQFVSSYVTPTGEVIDCFRTESQPGVEPDGPAKPPEFAGLFSSNKEPDTSAAARCPPGCYPELRLAPEERMAEHRAAAGKGNPFR